MSKGNKQWFAGGAMWGVGLALALLAGVGGCRAFAADPPAPVTTWDFTDHLPPVAAGVTVPASAPATTLRVEVASAPAPAPVYAASWWGWAVDDLAIPVVVALLGWLANRVRIWLRGRTLSLRFAEFGIAAASAAYQEFVRAAKDKSDGRLTEDQKKEAMGKATTVFLDLLRRDGMAVGKDIVLEMVPVWIEHGINWLKKDAKAAKTSLPFGSESSSTA